MQFRGSATRGRQNRRVAVSRSHQGQPERCCSPVQWHIRPVWMDAMEGFPSPLIRRLSVCLCVCLPSCLAEKWHRVCLEPVRRLGRRPCSCRALWLLPINSSSTSWRMKEPAWSVWRTRCCPPRDSPGVESAYLSTQVNTVNLGLNLHTTHKS